jgi:hypothetical protein
LVSELERRGRRNRLTRKREEKMDMKARNDYNDCLLTENKDGNKGIRSNRGRESDN